MKTLNIEWRHLDVDGETCDRCYDTGETIQEEVERLNRKLESQGVRVTWTDTKLGGSALTQSNTILFNGASLEELLDIRVSELLWVPQCPAASGILLQKCIL